MLKHIVLYFLLLVVSPNLFAATLAECDVMLKHYAKVRNNSNPSIRSKANLIHDEIFKECIIPQGYDTDTLMYHLTHDKPLEITPTKPKGKYNERSKKISKTRR